MKYFNLGCNNKCWECSRNCNIKDIMMCSIWPLYTTEYEVGIVFQEKEIYLNSENAEQFFNYFIMETLKPIAGMMISSGIDFNVVQQELKETAVAFYVARLKMIETQGQK